MSKLLSGINFISVDLFLQVEEQLTAKHKYIVENGQVYEIIEREDKENA